MSLWSRVFGTSDVQPEPAALLDYLRGLGLEVRAEVKGDDLGWFAAALVFDADATPLHVERFLATEEGIRAELNTWAAWLETCDYSPQNVPLMQHMISTRQLFTVRRPIDHSDEILVEQLCVAVCRFLARVTEGVYQADGQGFFRPDGTLLLQEY
jgi:hypothetical protein